jgi:tetratricopeptide (TPR) repeat protein
MSQTAVNLDFLSELEEITEFYEHGSYLQAYQAGKHFGALQEWPGAAGRVLAGRLARHLGAPRLARQLFHQARREAPSDPAACYYWVWSILERRGPYRAWRLLSQLGEFEEAPRKLRRAGWALHGHIAALFRDFETAEVWLARAGELCPDSTWIEVDRAFVLEQEDQYEEALAAARRSMQIQPWYYPAVAAAAHLLQLLDRDQESLRLLTDACGRLESAALYAQLAALQEELGLHAVSAQSLESFAAHAPLMETEVEQWLYARRCDVAYYRGDFAAASAHARLSASPLQMQMAERLAASSEGRRLLLPVGFVRQHYQTCAPATLAALSRHWSMPADHLEVAATICYGGTPHYSERLWAEEHGWVAREFTVTWESAIALLDRGVPFTLTITEPGQAHLQAVIGYDTRRHTLLARDPYFRNVMEHAAAPLLLRYRSTGPRGMALVPRPEAERLAGLELPDAELFDRLYQMQCVLRQHSRDAAKQEYESLRQKAPDHRLTQYARAALASYDASASEMLTATEQLLKLFPEDPLLQFSLLGCLRDLASRADRLARLKYICAQAGSAPVFWLQYALELSADARQNDIALVLLRRALRYAPMTAVNYHVLANVLWSERRFEEALTLYRLATCLDDKNEQFAFAYFMATRHFKQTDTALGFLEDRFARHAARSGLPARTLYWALCELQRSDEAFKVLTSALQIRPQDSELLVFAAQSHGYRGSQELAAELLGAAKGKAQPGAWLRAAAGLATLQGNLQGALTLWRQVLEAEPLALDAHRSVTQLLAETESREASLDHLRKACVRFPHHYGLRQFFVDWMRADGPSAAEPVIREHLRIHAADAWAHRELAITLAEQGRLEEAFAQLAVARDLQPDDPFYHCVLGRTELLAGRSTEAKESFRRAVRLSTDCEYAIRELVAACEAFDERRQALRFVEEELIRQVLFGDGLLAFRMHAQNVLDPEELLGRLRDALSVRPDLWHAWSAVIQQMTHMGQTAPAVELARAATARFPLLPRLWFDLALVWRARKDDTGEIEALQRALQINPSWGEAACELAGVYERAGKLPDARTLLEECLVRAPLHAPTHGWLAHVLWRLGDKEPALERLRHALRLDPGYQWAWNTLRDWSGQLGKPLLAGQIARDLANRRPGEVRSWMVLARTLSAPEALQERLTALDTAIRLRPRDFEAHDLKAELLASAGRFEEALEACQSALWADQVPLPLRGRAAWIEARRGRVKIAVKQMHPLVSADQTYYWGWSQLAEWSRHLNANADFLFAARNLVRLAPQHGDALSHFGVAAARSFWSRQKEIDQLLEHRPAATEALAAYVSTLGERGRRWRLGRCLARHRALLRQDSRLWGSAGYALVCIRAYRKTTAWLSDWSGRPGVSPWMLSNLVLALRNLGRHQEAHALSRHAAGLPRDHTSSLHELWLAAEDALAGDSPSATKRLKDLDATVFAPYYEAMRNMAKAVCEVQCHGRRGFVSAKRYLRQAATQTPMDHALVSIYRRSLRRVAHDCGGFLPAIWSFWQRLKT